MWGGKVNKKFVFVKILFTIVPSIFFVCIIMNLYMIFNVKYSLEKLQFILLHTYLCITCTCINVAMMGINVFVRNVSKASKYFWFVVRHGGSGRVSGAFYFQPPLVLIIPTVILGNVAHELFTRDYRFVVDPSVLSVHRYERTLILANNQGFLYRFGSNMLKYAKQTPANIRVTEMSMTVSCCYRYRNKRS